MGKSFYGHLAGNKKGTNRRHESKKKSSLILTFSVISFELYSHKWESTNYRRIIIANGTPAGTDTPWAWPGATCCCFVATATAAIAARRNFTHYSTAKRDLLLIWKQFANLWSKCLSKFITFLSLRLFFLSSVKFYPRNSYLIVPFPQKGKTQNYLMSLIAIETLFHLQRENNGNGKMEALVKKRNKKRDEYFQSTFFPQRIIFVSLLRHSCYAFVTLLLHFSYIRVTFACTE